MVSNLREKATETVKKRGGWLVKPPEERKVMIFAYVCGKHAKKAQKEIKEHCRQYR